MKVHLVDGTYELFRAYYGSPPRETADGFEVGAVHGLARSMLALLGDTQVTHVAIAFDHVIESFRNELYAGYKTGDGIDPKLHAQFWPAEDACRALGIVVWPMIELECDDALATAATRFAALPEVDQVVICSPDKDLAQCVRGARVVCLDRLRGKTLDENGVHAKFGVGPASIPDWLALVGDAADGYPGIPRWGAKSASGVLSAYGRLERIPDDAAAWTVKVRGAAALAQSLTERRSEALLYRTLATLREDAPLAETLAHLEWRGPAPAADSAAVLRLELDGLLERAADVAARKANGAPKR
ncbi:MAG TPA: 5'-3' exonuclease H3TH domain-containing protein [Gammaproteobacteria bacterium]|nr:5'-3' exonuclease H3TH domain-containing protein [Gammaproteobacteria bacterium]